MKSNIFASTLAASSAFTFALAGKSRNGGSSLSYSTKGYSSRRSSSSSSCSSSSDSSSCSSSSSSSCSSSSSDEKCGPQFKVIRNYENWCDYAKVCHKHHMVPAKITSRNIYDAVRAIRRARHRSAWIKSWNTDPYRGNLVLTVPNQRCDGAGSITVACKGVRKVALCMRKKDDTGDCHKKKKHSHHKNKKHHYKKKKHGKKSYRKSRKSTCSSSSSSSSCSSTSSSSSSSSSSRSENPYNRRPVALRKGLAPASKAKGSA